MRFREAPGRFREAPGRFWEAPGRLLETVGGSRRAQKAPGRLQEALGRLWELKMEAPGGVSLETWHGDARILGPPNTQKLNTEKPKAQCTEHRRLLIHSSAPKRGGGYFYRFKS